MIIFEYVGIPNFNIANEIWKPIIGYENTYSVSNYGRVRRETKKVINSIGKTRVIKGRVLKNKINRNNYCYVALSLNGEVKWFFNHTLVAKAFIDNPNNYPVVNHIDENPRNNFVDNLEWTTYSGNAKHSIDKIYKSHENETVEVIRINPITKEEVVYKGIRFAAEENNVYHSNIRAAILRGGKCGGYYWRYQESSIPY